MSNSKKRAVRAAETALDKKAKDTIILELKDLSTIADYFVICSGDNTSQIRAIAEAIQENFSKQNIFPLGKEGLDFARWVLIDYGDIIINIFDDETRDYYELEKLWIDAPRIPVEEHKK
ncbi:MAG: ribosome silencing factor [Nitrospirae bacterium]|nr:ribosome silencing factor [Nitrospirota bacterium]